MRRHLTYSNIMSTIAAFAALTTGGAFAATQITGKNIKDGSIKSVDIANGTIRAADLGDNAFHIGSGDIIDGQVFTGDIRDGGVTHADIHTNSVDETQLADSLANRINAIAADTHAPITNERIKDGEVGICDLDAGLRSLIPYNSGTLADYPCP
jgi:hypothetical protein